MTRGPETKPASGFVTTPLIFHPPSSRVISYTASIRLPLTPMMRTVT
jgi:hypothetical protein